MEVTVRVWGNLRRFLPDGQGSAAIQVPDDTTVESLADQLALKHELWAAAVNGRVVELSTRLRPGDRVVLFDHVHGG